MNIKQFIIPSVSAALIISGLFYFRNINHQNLNAAESDGEVKSFVIKLKIDGMSCGSCAYSARKALEKVKFVKNAEVDYDSKIAKVYPQKGKSVDVNELIRSIEKIGFKARLIKTVN